jgi:hypothetical protein
MSTPVNRYGFTGAYGDGTYKGELPVVTGNVRGLSASAYKKCFHLGLTEPQGLGWAEVRGGDPVWPESRGSVLSVYDENSLALVVVYDEATGLPYIINPRTGPTNSRLTNTWKDKVDPNADGSGTTIPTYAKLPEHHGDKKHYDVAHAEGNLTVRPVVASEGLPGTLEFDSYAYTNGSTTSTANRHDIDTDIEYTYPEAVRGKTVQHEIRTNEAEYRVTKVEQYYVAGDNSRTSRGSVPTEATYEAELATPAVWISRGANLLLNRATGLTLATGAGTATTGPDGRSNSALTITTPVLLGNSVLASGTTMLWHKSGYTISGVTLTQHGTSGSWILSYANTSPANITLPVGDVFDVRVYSGVIGSAARTDYYNNIVNDAGRR